MRDVAARQRPGQAPARQAALQVLDRAFAPPRVGGVEFMDRAGGVEHRRGLLHASPPAPEGRGLLAAAARRSARRHSRAADSPPAPPPPARDSRTRSPWVITTRSPTVRPSSLVWITERVWPVVVADDEFHRVAARHTFLDGGAGERRRPGRRPRRPPCGRASRRRWCCRSARRRPRRRRRRCRVRVPCTATGRMPTMVP